MIVLLSFVSILFIIGYYLFIKPHNYWKDRGVQFEKPTFLFGHWGPVFLLEYPTSILYKKFYDKYVDKRYIPLYQFLTPMLLVKDLELIKKIAIKDFDSFPEHANFISTDADPLWSKNMFIMPGDQEWKDIRSVLSPAFTKNKLKIMFNLMVSCSKQFVNNFDKFELTSFEAKGAFSKATNDIIATTALGVECNSMENPKNELYLAGQDLLNANGFFFKLKFFLAFVSPSLSKIFKIRLISEKNTQFFRSTIINTIKIREKEGIIRPDMIHLMMEARKEKPENDDADIISDKTKIDSYSLTSKSSILTDDVVVAQALVFYFGGFDTISSSLSFMAYELAVNPDIQEKLFGEILDAFVECDGEITYEALLNMKYLDMVVSESLRKWPPFAATDRKTVKPFTIKFETEKSLVIDENVICLIPIYPLHRDALYWPEPDKFDPERFNDENKSKIKPFTYIPFGVGPRSCIANRFAILAIKTLVVHLLHKFEIVTVGRTKIPLELSVNFPDLNTADDYWLGLNPRN